MRKFPDGSIRVTVSLNRATAEALRQMAQNHGDNTSLAARIAIQETAQRRGLLPSTQAQRA